MQDASKRSAKTEEKKRKNAKTQEVHPRTEGIPKPNPCRVRNASQKFRGKTLKGNARRC